MKLALRPPYVQANFASTFESVTAHGPAQMERVALFLQYVHCQVGMKTVHRSVLRRVYPQAVGSEWAAGSIRARGVRSGSDGERADGLHIAWCLKSVCYKGHTIWE